MPSDLLKAARRALQTGALLAMACVGAAQAQPAVPAQAALCAACHGAQGNSRTPSVPSLAGQPKVFLENTLVLIREGLRDIPAMKGMLDKLPDSELTALAVYFNAQTPLPQTTRPQAEVFARGKDIAQKMMCASCHQADYSGRAQIPRLAAQPEPYLLESMKTFRDHPGAGRDTIMAATLYGVKDQELADMAHYLAHLK